MTDTPQVILCLACVRLEEDGNLSLIANGGDVGTDGVLELLRRVVGDEQLLGNQSYLMHQEPSEPRHITRVMQDVDMIRQAIAEFQQE